MYVFIYLYTCIYVYIYIYRERERQADISYTKILRVELPGELPVVWAFHP